MHLNIQILRKGVGRYAVFVFAWIFLFFTIALKAQYNDSVFNAAVLAKIELHDVDAGKNISLNEGQTEKPLTLFVFLSPECPLCQNYSGKLNELNKQYEGQVTIYGIIPGKAYADDVIKEFRRRYNIQFPLLVDHDKKLTSYLQATVTPQVILLNDKNDLVYKGAIDDWAVSPGTQRVTTTAFFLRDALQQYISGKTVLINRTKAVGCRINDY